MARRIGSETVRYVSNILKYYVAFKLLLQSPESDPDGAAAARANERSTG